MEHLSKHLEGWHDFYVLVGTGASALTGLLFVIVSLGPHVAERQKLKGVRAYVSPVATHFVYVLVVSAVMLAPELPVPFLGALLAAAGVGGIVYSAWTRAHELWRKSELSILDWIWFIALPYGCFTLLLLSGIGMYVDSPRALYGVGSFAVLMIVVGIRNAWDLVLWVAQQRRPEEPKRKKWRKP
jgi:hypothetical protein